MKTSRCPYRWTRFSFVAALVIGLASPGPGAAQVPTDALDFAIAGSDDHVYAWFADGTVSSGDSRRLDKYRTPYAYGLPPGKTAQGVVGLAIAGSDDHVYAWYADGTGATSPRRARSELERLIEPGATACSTATAAKQHPIREFVSARNDYRYRQHVRPGRRNPYHGLQWRARDRIFAG